MSGGNNWKTVRVTLPVDILKQIDHFAIDRGFVGPGAHDHGRAGRSVAMLWLLQWALDPARGTLDLPYDGAAPPARTTYHECCGTPTYTGHRGTCENSMMRGGTG